MSVPSAAQFVESFVRDIAGHEADIDRFVGEPSGLDAAGIVAALDHPVLRQPGNQPIGIQMMADFMAPEGSVYYDSIYGAFHGQAEIRAWLLPTMASIDFIEFAPTAEPVLFDDGCGGTSLDEWEMVAVIGDDRLPLSRGVSVRRFRDGWITWACDVYDTSPFRQPPPADAEQLGEVEAAPLPEWPRTTWTPDERVAETRVADVDFAATADEFHPTDSVYHDPIFGAVRGRDAIRAWLSDVMGKVGNVVFEPLGPLLDDGATSVQEWQQMAVLPDGQRVFMTRGTSVRRSCDGYIVYAADYFDTASLFDHEIIAASSAAGSTIGPEDILRHRRVP